MKKTHTFRHRGFSLVEVVLAIGVVSFAFVAIFALIPLGLGSFRQAIDNSVGSQIVQRLINEAQQTDYPTLTATPATQRYFDDQGNEVTSINDSIYTVQISVLAPTTLPNSVTPASDSLATVTVKIANNPAHRASPFDSTAKTTYGTYSALIAKNQ